MEADVDFAGGAASDAEEVLAAFSAEGGGDEGGEMIGDRVGAISESSFRFYATDENTKMQKKKGMRYSKRSYKP